MSENSPTEGGLGAEPHLSETCAVDYEVLKRCGLLAARWRFVAWVSAPDGRRALARSPLVYGHTPEIQRALGAVKALNELVKLVSGAGWSALPCGQNSYSPRFERLR